MITAEGIAKKAKKALKPHLEEILHDMKEDVDVNDVLFPEMFEKASKKIMKYLEKACIIGYEKGLEDCLGLMEKCTWEANNG